MGLEQREGEDKPGRGQGQRWGVGGQGVFFTWVPKAAESWGGFQAGQGPYQNSSWVILVTVGVGVRGQRRQAERGVQEPCSERL